MAWLSNHALVVSTVLVMVLVAGGIVGAVALGNRDSDESAAPTSDAVTGTVTLAGCDAPATDVRVFGLPWQVQLIDSPTSAAPSESDTATPSATSASPDATPSADSSSPEESTPSATPTRPQRTPTPTDSESPSGNPLTPTPTNLPTLPTLSPSPEPPGIRGNPAAYRKAIHRAADAAPSTPDVSAPAAPSEVAAKVERLSNGTYRFELPGDEPGAFYRLRLDVTTPGCERIAWRPVAGLTYGSAMAGGPPAQISGEVLDTALEVLQSVSSAQRIDGRVLGTWGTSDTVDWTDPSAATRVFHWSSAAPGVTTGRWEVSALPFPDSCLAPPGPVIARGTAPYAAGALSQNFMSTSFDIDFAAVMRSVKETAEATTPTSDRLSYVAASIANILRPSTLWVRVVPLTSDGATSCAAAPSNQVRIDFGSGEAATVQNIDGWGGARPVEVDWESYTPYRPGKAIGNVPVIEIIAPHTLPKAGDTNAVFQDPMGFAIVASKQAQFGQTVPVGQRYVLWQTPPDDSAWEEFGDALWTIGEQVGLGLVVDAVNWVSGVYEDVKAGVVEVLADVITATGIVDCGEGSTCREGISAALTAGLVALGLPPSLPNFSELANQGLDYLAAQISAQAQIPLDDALVVAKEAIDELSQRAASGGAGAGFPGLGQWYIDLRAAQLGSMTLRVTRPADSPDGPNVGAMNLIGDVYRAATSAPQLQPGQSVTFPITLLPQTDNLGFSGGDPKYTQAAWLNDVFNPSDQTSLTVTAGPQSSVLGVLDFPTHTEIGYGGVPTTITNGG